jgi:hypothetical protein
MHLQGSQKKRKNSKRTKKRTCIGQRFEIWTQPIQRGDIIQRDQLSKVLKIANQMDEETEDGL